MARPTKFNGDTVTLTEEYIENYAESGDVMPSISGLARQLGVCRETVRAWGHEEGKEAFSAILAVLQTEQEHRLLNGGLSGELNSNIVKLALGKHGYTEKRLTEHVGDVMKTLQPIMLTMTPQEAQRIYLENIKNCKVVSEQ